MKKLLLILFVLLASCAPAAVEATVTPAPTSTPIPTATVIPTPTLAPDFIALQETIAQTDNYTLMGDGQIEVKQPDGTVIPVPGIRLNKDGKSYTIMVDGKEVTIDVNDVTISDEGGISVKGYMNVDGMWMVVEQTYTPDAWGAMDQTTRDSVKDTLPLAMTYTDEATQVTVELNRGGFSTVKDNLVRYENENHEVVQVFNVFTGEYGDPLDNGIHDIPLNDGTFWEVLGFHNMTDAINYAGAVDGAHGRTADMQSQHPDSRAVAAVIRSIIGFDGTYWRGINVTDELGNSFGVNHFACENGSAIEYLNRVEKLHVVYVNEPY